MRAIKILSGEKLSNLVADDQLFEAADLNAIGITDALVAGVVLSVPERTFSQLQDERLPQLPKPLVVTSLNGQGWIDICLQELGDEARIFELADKNAVGITDALAPGTVCNCPEADVAKKRTVSLLRRKKPACDPGNNPNNGEGIEFWAIEFDFKVS
jgi:hypothetical protein